MLNLQNRDLVIYAGRGNLPLAEKIAKELGRETRFIPAELGSFPDGETDIKNSNNFFNSNVFIVQSTGASDDGKEILSPDQNEKALQMMIRSAKEQGANKITAVIPYFGYARADRKVGDRNVISAQISAHNIESQPVDDVILVDLHSRQIQGFFTKAVTHHIESSSVIIERFKSLIAYNPSDFVVVPPDEGATKRSTEYRSALRGTSFASLNKNRENSETVHYTGITGSVEGKNVIMVDDMISTGGTLIRAAEYLKEQGAKDIYVGTVHPVLSPGASERLQSSPIKEVFLLDTIQVPQSKIISKMQIGSCAPLIADRIERLHMGYDLIGDIKELRKNAKTSLGIRKFIRNPNPPR